MKGEVATQYGAGTKRWDRGPIDRRNRCGRVRSLTCSTTASPRRAIRSWRSRRSTASAEARRAAPRRAPLCDGVMSWSTTESAMVLERSSSSTTTICIAPSGRRWLSSDRSGCRTSSMSSWAASALQRTRAQRRRLQLADAARPPEEPRRARDRRPEHRRRDASVGRVRADVQGRTARRGAPLSWNAGASPT